MRSVVQAAIRAEKKANLAGVGAGNGPVQPPLQPPAQPPAAAQPPVAAARPAAQTAKPPKATRARASSPWKRNASQEVVSSPSTTGNHPTEATGSTHSPSKKLKSPTPRELAEEPPLGSHEYKRQKILSTGLFRDLGELIEEFEEHKELQQSKGAAGMD